MSLSLENLAARLRRVEDREAIRDLVARYGPLADSGDAAGVAGLWSDEGSYIVNGHSTAEGRRAIAGLIESREHQALMADGCAHLLGPLAIELDGDSATARGHSVVFRRTSEGFAVYRVSANRWTFARSDAGWQVMHRTNALLDGSEAARMLLSA